jgi:hypothetical protein
MERVDYGVINAARTENQRLELLEQEIERVGYICLTDALVHPDQCGSLMLAWLQNEETRNMRSGTQRKWMIKVIRDAWGKELKPGDFVTRKIMLPLKDRAGRLLTSRVLNKMRQRGAFDKTFIEERKFKVDEKGCIECSYDDAVYFLVDYGVHFETRHAITGRREMSSGPCKAPDDTMRHVWYWRYEEAPPWVYSRLKKLKKS